MYMNYGLRNFVDNLREYGFGRALLEDVRETHHIYTREAAQLIDQGNLAGILLMIPISLIDSFRDKFCNE